MYSIRKMAKGFTLIELLIVIAIIGILAVAFLPALTGGPAKARDAARVATVNDIVATIESLIADGASATDLDGNGADADDCLDFDSAGLGQTIAQEMRKTPKDYTASSPSELCDTPDSEYYYAYLGTSPTGYLVAVQLELENAGNADGSVVDETSITVTDDITTALGLTDSVPRNAEPFYYIVAK